MSNKECLLRMAYGFLYGEFPEADDASLEELAQDVEDDLDDGSFPNEWSEKLAKI